MAEKKKYNYMENTLQLVIKKTISLSQDEKKTNNAILLPVIEQVVCKIKEQSALFKTLYQQIFHGGSFYDGLKVGKPEEYDLDLMLALPKNCVPELTPEPEVEGFVSMRLHLTTGDNSSNDLRQFLDGEYLSTVKVLNWMEGLMTKALLQFPQTGSQSVITIGENEFYVKNCKSGPAFTLKLNGNVDDKPLNFDVDLVPCFICDAKLWPPKPFRQNPVSDKTKFFIVPKKPNNVENLPDGRFWRLSFPEQEGSLISGLKTLKPSIKLLKKLRDNLQHKGISSYFIKTVFLREVVMREPIFWDCSLSYVFMEMLKVYTAYLIDKNIPYFWNDKNNLIKNISSETLANYSNRMKNICSEIDRKQDDHIHVATFFLAPEEVETLKSEVVISKKMQKLQEAEETVAVSGACGKPKSNKQSESNDGYNIILSRLEALRLESSKVVADVADLKRDNIQLRDLMISMSDTLSVLGMKFTYLENRYNRPE